MRGLGRSASRDRADSLTEPGVVVALGDLTDPASLAPLCAGIDVVYGIAATCRTAGQRTAPPQAVNADGGPAQIAAARAAGVARFVRCSTGGVHGRVECPQANEDALLAPGDVYPRPRLEGERLAQAAGEEDGLVVVVARPIGIYGPGETRFLKVFRGIARCRFPMLGGGRVFYHLPYIDDIVKGFRLCAEPPGAEGQTHLLGVPRYTTLAELVCTATAKLRVPSPRGRVSVSPVGLAGSLSEAICVPLGIEPTLYRQRADLFTKSRAFGTTPARRELRVTPAVDLAEEIRRTAAWYRVPGWL